MNVVIPLNLFLGYFYFIMKILLNVIVRQTIKRSIFLFTFTLLYTVIVKSSRLNQNYEYYIDFNISLSVYEIKMTFYI